MQVLTHKTTHTHTQHTQHTNNTHTHTHTHTHSSDMKRQNNHTIAHRHACTPASVLQKVAQPPDTRETDWDNKKCAMHHMHSLCVYNKINITKPQLEKTSEHLIPITVKCSNWERESIFCRINGSSALSLHSDHCSYCTSYPQCL